MLRKAVLTEPRKVVIQFSLDFAGNEAAQLSSSFELAVDPTVQLPPAGPALCKILTSSHRGSMALHIKRAVGTVNVPWYYTIDPTQALEYWPCRLANDDTLVIPGLKPGERLRARVACLNGASTMDNLAFAKAKTRYVE